MAVHGVEADVQLFGDFLAEQSVMYQSQHFQFSLRKEALVIIVRQHMPLSSAYVDDFGCPVLRSAHGIDAHAEPERAIGEVRHRIHAMFHPVPLALSIVDAKKITQIVVFSPLYRLLLDDMEKSQFVGMAVCQILLVGAPEDELLVEGGYHGYSFFLGNAERIG